VQERFGSAQLGYSTAYSAVRRLLKDGCVRAAPGRRDGEVVIYEATEKGVARFRDWLLAPASAPVLREDLHARIALSEPRDLPRLIDVVYAQECGCVAALERIRSEVAAQHADADPRPPAEVPWSSLVNYGVLNSEADFWIGRIAQLGNLRSYLEELRGEAERRAAEEHWPGLQQRRQAG
jgi:DNA-binding PadR family transcriptional regulator